MTVNVLGAGSWGTALAILLARNGQEVAISGRNTEDLLAMADRRENFHYLPGFVLPRELRTVQEPADLPRADLWVLAVPASGLRWAMERVPTVSPTLVVASKGLEMPGARILTDVLAEEIPSAKLAVLSGPNLAVEIVRQVPTAAVAASTDPDTAELARRAFMCATYRVYLSDDVVGVELAGALKNVLAIGAGLSDALGFGENTKGALLARGLGEMTRLGLAMGGRIETFLGIAGVGDLFATAASTLSRNYRVGRAVGEGQSLKEALEGIGQVAEGVPTSEAVLTLAHRHQVPVPVFEAVEAVLRGRLKPRDAVGMLMERMPKREPFLEVPHP